MTLVDNAYSEKWIEQFDSVDRPLARALLGSLKLVSHSEFERRIVQLILEIVQKTEGQIALFPVSRLPRRPSPGKEKRPYYGSAERIGQTLTNIERTYPRRFKVAPTVLGMRSEKTRHVVLVDDMVGSGGRIRDYCYGLLRKSVKSWLSYHKCTLWIVAFAAYRPSIQSLVDRFGYLHLDNVVLYVDLPDKGTPTQRGRIGDLCRRYATNTTRPGLALGYGGLMSPIIFQHGCPNNAPAILWAPGNGWRPLFPNRGIPLELDPCFESGMGDETALEALWQSAQHRLALAIIDRMNSGRTNANDIKCIVILGLLARGVQHENLSQLTLWSHREISEIIELAESLKLITADHRVTDFGRDVLARFRNQEGLPKLPIESNEDAIQFYYPRQYKGVQRKSSV
jgi:hypothetical protein